MSTRIIVVDVVGVVDGFIVVSVVNGVVVVIIIGVVVVVVCVVVDVDGVFVVGVVVVVVIGPTILLFIWKVFCFRVDWKGWKAFLDQFFFNATRLLKQHAMMISTKRSCPLPQIPFRLTGCTIFFSQLNVYVATVLALHNSRFRNATFPLLLSNDVLRNLNKGWIIW